MRSIFCCMVMFFVLGSFTGEARSSDFFVNQGKAARAELERQEAERMEKVRQQMKDNEEKLVAKRIRREEEKQRREAKGFCLDGQLMGVITLAAAKNDSFVARFGNSGTNSFKDRVRMGSCKDFGNSYGNFSVDCISLTGEYPVGIADLVARMGPLKMFGDRQLPDSVQEAKRAQLANRLLVAIADGAGAGDVLAAGKIRVANQRFTGFSTVYEGITIDYTGDRNQGIMKLRADDYSFSFSYGSSEVDGLAAFRLIDTRGPVHADVSQRFSSKNQSFDVRQNDLIRVLGQWVALNCDEGILQFVQKYTLSPEYRETVIDYIIKQIKTM